MKIKAVYARDKVEEKNDLLMRYGGDIENIIIYDSPLTDRKMGTDEIYMFANKFKEQYSYEQLPNIKSIAFYILEPEPNGNSYNIMPATEILMSKLIPEV